MFSRPKKKDAKKRVRATRSKHLASLLNSHVFEDEVKENVSSENGMSEKANSRRQKLSSEVETVVLSTTLTAAVPAASNKQAQRPLSNSSTFEPFEPGVSPLQSATSTRVSIAEAVAHDRQVRNVNVIAECPVAKVSVVSDMCETEWEQNRYLKICEERKALPSSPLVIFSDVRVAPPIADTTDQIESNNSIPRRAGLRPRRENTDQSQQLKSNNKPTGMVVHPTAELQQAYYDSFRNDVPVAVVTAKAGVVVPDCWPPGLIFTGETCAGGWPAINELLDWYMLHKVDVNEKVRIKPSPGRGMGCFANKNIKKKERVGVFSGNLRSQRTTHTSHYVVKFQPVGYHDDDQWEIDAEFGGNELRYANYPSENEEVNLVATFKPKGGQHNVTFFASRDIQEGEELLWDYGNSFHDNLPIE